MIAYARMNRERLEVYDESAHQVCNVHIGSDARVVGNTTRTVSIKRGEWLYVYDENGREFSSDHIG